MPYSTNPIISTDKINQRGPAFRQSLCANDPHLIRLVQSSNSYYLFYMEMPAGSYQI
jgi:hypothetical protein